MNQKQRPDNPGAGLIERFRTQHVAVRWGVIAALVFLIWILLTAL